jgi:Flp pilus assembly protein TadG
MWKLRLRLRRQALRLSADTSGIAAVEFAMLVPLMLMIFFGTIQISTAVAVDRKVSLSARTLSDLISQAASVTSTDFSNAFGITTAILSPYATTTNNPLKAKITEIYITPITLAPKIVWSNATSNTTAHSCTDSSTLTVPAALLIGDTYLVLSEATYNYQPIAGYDIKAGFVSTTYPLMDSMYTRPRQQKCVLYPAVTLCTGVPQTATTC